MTSVYIAGPMRGIKDFNFPAFDAAATSLRTAGFHVLNPADRDRNVHGADMNKSETGDLADLAPSGFSLREALGYDMEWIARSADAVAVLPGWEQSRGALAEVALAHALDLVVAPVDAFVDANLEPMLYGTDPVLPTNPDLTLEMGEVLVDAPDDADYQDAYEWTETNATIAPIDDLSDAEVDEFLATVKQEMRATPFPAALDEAYGRVLHNELADDRKEGIEVRSVSSTGGEKGVKSERFDLIPVAPLRLLARLFGEGAKKYDDRNWERGYEWSKSFAALNRHLWLWWEGEDFDDETGVPHTVNVAWHAFVLTQFATEDRYSCFDDRP